MFRRYSRNIFRELFTEVKVSSIYNYKQIDPDNYRLVCNYIFSFLWLLSIVLWRRCNYSDETLDEINIFPLPVFHSFSLSNMLGFNFYITHTFCACWITSKRWTELWYRGWGWEKPWLGVCVELTSCETTYCREGADWAEAKVLSNTKLHHHHWHATESQHGEVWDQECGYEKNQCRAKRWDGHVCDKENRVRPATVSYRTLLSKLSSANDIIKDRCRKTSERINS